MDAVNHLPRPDPRWALFLDVDGTLVDIAPTPDAVTVGHRLVALLGVLNATLDGAVALISGRQIAKLDELFTPLLLPAAGNHGLERRNGDGVTVSPGVAPNMLDPVRADFDRFADARAGVVVEDKELSIALHYRLAPETAAPARRFAESLAARLGPGFRVQPGKMMVELRPVGADKGSGIEAFMAEPPFAGRIPVFVGDDVTDEDGFNAVNRLGGHSIRVGNSIATVAHWRVAGIDALLDWLGQIAATLPART
jgi:trehalose 6-phosphate phosphatase